MNVPHRGWNKGGIINKYTMIFTMKVLKKDFKQKEELEEKTEAMLKESGKNIAQIVAEASFKIWQEKDFREMIKFNNISQTEADRMFNELELTALGLFILHLDRVSSKTADETKRIVFKGLQENIRKGFIEIFKELGIEEKYLEQWRGLIDMRLREYRKDYKIALKQIRDMKKFNDEEELKVIWVRIETLTIDGLIHIRRGNFKAEDFLWKYLRKWLTELDVSFGKITSTILGPIAQV